MMTNLSLIAALTIIMFFCIVFILGVTVTFILIHNLEKKLINSDVVAQNNPSKKNKMK